MKTYPYFDISHETRVCFKYFVNDCFWKEFFTSNSPKTTSNFISFKTFSILSPFTQFSTYNSSKSFAQKCQNFLYFLTAFTIFTPWLKFGIERLSSSI